ncbi:T9SS type A sorting domain-containing protein, partial [candidate division KSB1 bacterium]|nr:T9SS type A sorting domain-containing protein [candidate division KSB1 bacterium]
PDKIELLQNYPNPFNSNTKIRYKLTGKGHVKIQIFNIYGQHVKTLYDKKQNPGMYSTNWNGKNDFGETVSSGVYFCRLALDEQIVETIRLVFLK